MTSTEVDANQFKSLSSMSLGVYIKKQNPNMTSWLLIVIYTSYGLLSLTSHIIQTKCFIEIKSRIQNMNFNTFPMIKYI